MMKKSTAILAAALLLIGSLVCGVAADGFEFRETSREVYDQTLVVGWNATEVPEGTAVELLSVSIGDTALTCSVEQPGMVSADIAAVPPGEYEGITYVYAVDGVENTVTVGPAFTQGGMLAVTLTMAINGDGSVTVTAIDDNGQPVAGYQLLLSIGAMTNLSEKTGADGTFTSLMTLQYGEKAVCAGIQTVIGGITYTDATQVEQVYAAPTTTAPPTTTTTAGETTTTTEETTTTTEVTTTTEPTTTTTVAATSATVAANATTATTPAENVTIKGTGTTAKRDDKIAVNVSLDTNILSLFGVKEKDFNDDAYMLISEENYNNLVGRSANILMLNVLTAEQAATDAQIAAAVAGVSKFSGYDEEYRSAITFDLSFLILDKTTGDVVPVSALPLNSTYVVQLPVPASMKNCDVLAVTMFDDDGLMEPMEVKAKNGCIQLEINSLEAYTLIGFHSESGKNAGGQSTLLVILLIVGILLLAGAAVLLYLFVLRKPEPKKPEPQKEPYVPEALDENDIFSGRDDYPEINRRPPTDD